MIHHFGVSPQKKSVFRSVEEDKIKNTYFIYSNICTHFITPAGIFPYNLIKDYTIEQLYSLENSDVAFEIKCFKLSQKVEMGKKKRK